jgi:hypothetical protein
MLELEWSRALNHIRKDLNGNKKLLGQKLFGLEWIGPPIPSTPVQSLHCTRGVAPSLSSLLYSQLHRYQVQGRANLPDSVGSREIRQGRGVDLKSTRSRLGKVVWNVRM